jgi:hypothetical protein
VHRLLRIVIATGSILAGALLGGLAAGSVVAAQVGRRDG